MGFTATHHVGRKTGYFAQRALAKAIDELSNDGNPMTPDKALALAKLVETANATRKSLERPWLRKGRRPRTAARSKSKSSVKVVRPPTELGAPTDQPEGQ